MKGVTLSGNALCLGYCIVTEGVVSTAAAVYCPSYIHSSIPVLVFVGAKLVIFRCFTKKFTNILYFFKVKRCWIWFWDDF